MKDRVLLISHDAALAQRVQLLVQRLSVDLQWRHPFEPPSRWPEFPIVLLDEDGLPDDWIDDTENAVIDAAAQDQAAEAPSRRTVLLLASQGVRRNTSLQLGFRDILYKDHRLSHLPWVLQEHLNALRLRRVRQRQENDDDPDLDPSVFSLRHEINNPLSGILGNAELALAGKAKIPADVRERLERIAQLAMQIRELLHSPAAGEWMAGSGDPRRSLSARSGALLTGGTSHGAPHTSLR